MTKELNEVLTKIRRMMTSSMKQLTLSKREIHVLLKYINDLEKELGTEVEIKGINDLEIKILLEYIRGKHEVNN